MPCFKMFLDNASCLLRECEDRYPKIDWGAVQKDNTLVRTVFCDLIYVLECFTYFLVYRKGEFSDDVDVRNLNLRFTEFMKVDYYPRIKRLTTRQYVDFENKQHLEKESVEAKAIRNLKYLDGVRNREFGQMIENLCENPDVQPCFENVPFFGVKRFMRFNKVSKSILKSQPDYLPIGVIYDAVNEIAFKLTRQYKTLQEPLDEEKLVWGKFPLDDDTFWCNMNRYLDKAHIECILDVCLDIEKSILSDCLK